MFRIRETQHYRIHHKRDVPLSLVTEIILTGKRKRIGKDLVSFSKKSKKQELYVLCRVDLIKKEMRVINAKRKRL